MTMWSKRAKSKNGNLDTLVGQNTEIAGDFTFSGGLHVDGSIKGNVVAQDDTDAMLTLSEHGSIEGEVRVPNVMLNGTVKGDVHCSERIVLGANANVRGTVYYNLIEMAIGAAVNGSLVHRDPQEHRLLTVDRQGVEAGSDAEPRVSEEEIRVDDDAAHDAPHESIRVAD